MKPIQSESQGPSIVVVAASSDEYPRQSEPAIIERGDGTLFMIWQEYLASDKAGEHNAPSYLAVRL